MLIIKENSRFCPIFSGELQEFLSYEDKIDNHTLLSYTNKYPHYIYNNIYLDKETKQLVSASQNYDWGADPLNHHFIGMAHEFFHNRYTVEGKIMCDMINVIKTKFTKWSNDKPCDGRNSEFDFGLLKDKTLQEQDSVLIIGGGPSANYIDFSNYYDMPVWTMNNFYKHKDAHKFNNIQLMPILDDVDITDQGLLDFIKEKDPCIIQEITELGEERIEKVRSLSDNWGYLHTRYRSKLGMGARLLAFASNLHIKNIYFCGLDGYNLNSQETHSFEKGKDYPRWLKIGGKFIQDQQYQILFDYVFQRCMASQSKLIDLSKDFDTIQYKFIYDS